VNVEVVEAYFRVKAVQIIGEGIKLAEQGQFD
jgi:hypothetical protein